MIKDRVVFIGLDFETSVGDVETGAPIQIGLSMGPFEDGYHTQSWDIGGWSWDQKSPVRWSEESAKIHNITQERLQKADNVFEVDVFASAWLLPYVKGYERMNRIAVQWNVGSFDRQFVVRHMPNLNKILSYRTLDLNSVCFFLANRLGESFENLKRKAKEYAQGALWENGSAPEWHDAGYDAVAGLIQFEYLSGYGIESKMVENMFRQVVKE